MSAIHLCQNYYQDCILVIQIDVLFIFYNMIQSDICTAEACIHSLTNHTQQYINDHLHSN
jgi:hypothetical protein